MTRCEDMSELLDVIDGEGGVLGQETRDRVHELGLLHRGVHVLVLDRAGRLLLQLRSPNADRFPGSYDISMSEHVKSGESYHEAALRGLEEELGIAGVPVKRLMRFRLVYGPGDQKISELYECRYDGVLRVDEGEVAATMFVPARELRTMLDRERRKFALWAQEILKWFLDMPSGIEELEEGVSCVGVFGKQQS